MTRVRALAADYIRGVTLAIRRKVYMRRVLMLAVLLAGCDATGPDDYARIDFSQTLALSQTTANVSIRRTDGPNLTGTWIAEYCTGGTFNFCTQDSGTISGTVDRGQTPTLSVMLHSDDCADGSLTGVYSPTAERIAGSASVNVSTSNGCVTRGGTF